jgi:hypothetical protein
VSTPIPTDPVADSGTAPARTLPSITAPALGLVGAVGALLAGAWLMYSPFLLGYQADGAEWADTTVSDFWSGLGLGVLALIAAGVLTAGLVAALRARGVLAPRPSPSAAPDAMAAPAAGGGGNDELTALLRPLIAALSQDTAAPARTETGTGLTTNHRVTDPADR